VCFAARSLLLAILNMGSVTCIFMLAAQYPFGDRRHH
jgi:hypothetical protein